MDSRRKWRITLILTLTTITLGTLWSWSRPRIDPRLVGRWESDDYQYGPFERSLHADGTTTTVEKVSQIGVSILPETWYVEGDTLYISAHYGGYTDTLSQLQERLRATWNEMTDRKNVFRQYRIIEITPTTLQIQRIDPDGRPEQPPYPYHRLAPGEMSWLESTESKARTKTIDHKFHESWPGLSNSRLERKR